MQAHPFDGGVQRFAHDVAVQAMPVPGGQARFFGDAVQVDVVGVVVLQVLQGAAEVLCVAGVFHWSRDSFWQFTYSVAGFVYVANLQFKCSS